MKTYTYTLFLRHPQTKEVQYGNIEIDSEGFVDFYELLENLKSSEISKAFATGYTLIAMQIVDVEET